METKPQGKKVLSFSEMIEQVAHNGIGHQMTLDEKRKLSGWYHRSVAPKINKNRAKECRDQSSYSF